MSQPLKTILGILLILASFTFLVWKFLYLELSFVNGMLLNILAFFGLGMGLMLTGSKTFSFEKRKEPYSPETIEKEKTKKEKNEIPLKDFKKDDHDRFMPK